MGKKTDRHDARELARRLFLGDVDRYATTYYPSDQEYGVRKVLRVRHQVVGIRQQVVNQIRALLNAYFVPAPGSVLDTRPSLKALAGLVLPTAELTQCLQTLASALQHTQGLIEQLTRQVRQQAQVNRCRPSSSSYPMWDRKRP